MIRRLESSACSGSLASVPVRWRRQGHPSHGRQDKAGCPAAGARRLKTCLHVVS